MNGEAACSELMLGQDILNHPTECYSSWQLIQKASKLHGQLGDFFFNLLANYDSLSWWKGTFLPQASKSLA